MDQKLAGEQSRWRPWQRWATRASLMAFFAIAAAPGWTAETLTPDQAARDVRILKRALNDLHPGLTKYQSEAEWQTKLARFEDRGQKARSPEALFLAAAELAASIRCGHTWTNVLNQQGAIKTVLLDTPNKLPFRVRWVEGRILVLDSADRRIRAGDEVLSIQGAVPADIQEQLWPYLRADGASDGKRWRQLSHDRHDYSQMDITWPLLSPPVAGQWRIRIRSGPETRNVSVRAVSLETRATRLAQQGIKDASEAWTFVVDGSTATLTLPTFSFWNSEFDWSRYLHDTFATLDAQDVQHLIIDIRANEGGDGVIGARIVQHLLAKPIEIISNQSTTRYERMPYDLARYLDTWDFGFFDRTGQVRSIVDGPQAGMLTFLPRYFGAQTFQPIAPRFRGMVYLLIGGENSSATFQFAQLAQRAGVATLVGQDTGGNLRGLNGGQLAWVNLPNSGVAVDIPLLATGYNADTPDAPIHPDVPVVRTFDAQRAGIDEELAVVRQLIAGQSAAGKSIDR